MAFEQRSTQQTRGTDGRNVFGNNYLLQRRIVIRKLVISTAPTKRKRSRGNQLIHRRLSKTKSIDNQIQRVMQTVYPVVD